VSIQVTLSVTFRRGGGTGEGETRVAANSLNEEAGHGAKGAVGQLGS